MHRLAIIYLMSVLGISSYGQNDSLMIVDQKIIFIDSIENKKIIIDQSPIDLSEFKLHQNENKNYLLNTSSGIVYQVRKDTIVRIDKSYDDKVHNHSLDFIYKDTLYRFGGYGYFNSNKTMIYYDEVSNQWDIVKYKGYQLIKGFNNVQLHFISNNKLYVFGYSSTDNEYQNDISFERKGFVFDFNTKSIEKTFEIELSFIFPFSYKSIDDDFVFLFPKKASEGLRILDKKSFEIYESNLSIGESDFYQGKGFNFSVLGDKLFYISENINKQKIVKSINIDSRINSKKLSKQKLIKTEDELYIIGVLLILLILVYLYFNPRNNTLFITPSYVKFNQTKIKLDSKSVQLLKLLSEKSKVSNSQMNDIFYNNELNPIHVNRTKNNAVKHINDLFYKKFKWELILKQKKDHDKREVEYFINPLIDKIKTTNL